MSWNFLELPSIELGCMQGILAEVQSSVVQVILVAWLSVPRRLRASGGVSGVLHACPQRYTGGSAGW